MIARTIAESPSALEGDLARFTLVEILQLMDLARASGRLELERPGERGTIVIERGRPVEARTSGGSVPIGEILVRRGVIPIETLETALTEQRDRPRRLGVLLVESGRADRDAVRGALEETLKRRLFGFMLWERGRFRFVAESTREGDALGPEIDLDSLFLAGSFRSDAPRVEDTAA